MSAVQLTDAKRHLNIDAGDTSQDAELQRTIEAAEAAIGNRVGPLSPTPVTASARGGAGELVLSTTPVIALLSAAPPVGNAPLITDLAVDADAGLITQPAGRFTTGSWSITYLAGYTDLPADLEQAVLEMVRHLWQAQRGPGGRGQPAQQAPMGGYLIPNAVAELIAPYEQVVGFA